ncbi:MAG: radical SAM protein [Spirochaetaceae bacterium]|jgi:nitrogen fixation protein NifB|nr:radical SAM protein [Spirochaetaceae bacterium]
MNAQLLHIANRHPCFSTQASMNRGRIHLPVSPVCNIQCRFCKRTFNKTENRPGVTARLLEPFEAVPYIKNALELCPEITVVGIAGPGDPLASPHALQTFRLIYQNFPEMINCLSTNGLLLERCALDMFHAGVQTVTVTVNAVEPSILEQICAYIIVDGVRYEGYEGAALLIEAQKRGIQKAADLGMVIKINTVLIPPINGDHIAEIARTLSGLGAGIINIIPLIPQYEFIDFQAPDCIDIGLARKAAEEFLPVFRHCQHCRADACGILGKKDLFSSQTEQTFSHG